MENLNLSDLKVGDEITTIHVKGGRIEYGPIRTIKAWDERFKRWRLTAVDPAKIGTFLPPDGCGFYFMQKKETPPGFYYSANPEHLKKAKASARKAELKRRRDAEEKMRRINLAAPIGEILKTTYSDDGLWQDTSDYVTETLIGYLTDEQILTLRSWMGIRPPLTF